MKTFLAIILLIFATTTIQAKDDDFKSVVKMIEKFYGVKHQGIPFLAKAGMKVATTAARIKGGTARRIAEAGSVKVAIFEDQAYIFVREAGDKFNVLVITIAQREGTVVQVTLSPKNLALLMKDPEGTG